VILDRIKASLFALVGAADPRAVYAGLFRAEVVSQTDDTHVDVKLDDPNLPGMSGVNLQVGLPGTVVGFRPGARMLIGFENRDPAKPFVALWAGGETVDKMTFNAAQVFVGGELGAQPPIKAPTFLTPFEVWAKAVAAAVAADPSMPGPAKAAVDAAEKALEIVLDGGLATAKNAYVR